MDCILALDTSNYTTSAAVVADSGKVLANIKIPLAVSCGERGLRQSDSVFAHVKNLPEISEMLRSCISELGITKILAVGVSAYPRDCEGSYMPCFLSGVSAAAYSAAALSVPLYRFSHQAGHVTAALYSSGTYENINNRFAAFHVSGGTTEILMCEGDSEKILKIEKIGGTLDINAGQAIDRCGVMMGFSFPAGGYMEEAALLNAKKISNSKLSVSGLCCNLSGLENKASKLWDETGDRSLVSAYVLDFIGATLLKMTDGLTESEPGIPIVYAGGVMRNSIIKSRLSGKNRFFALPDFSSDNAAGIALLTREKYIRENNA